MILAGGSTRIPRLQEILSNLLPGATLHCSVQQEAAVAHGAALYAAKMKGILTQELQLTEVLPWSLGTDVEGGMTSIILQKYTPIPAMKIQKYSTTVDNQKSFTIEVYEGDNERCADNHLLGSMVLTGIRLAPCGQTKVRVLFNVDEHGILQVKAKEVGSDNKISIKIERYKKPLTEGQVNSMRETASEERVQTQAVQLAEQMADLENKLENTLNAVQKKVIHKETLKVTAWSKNNPNPSPKAFDQLLVDLRETFAILGLTIKLDNSGRISYNTETPR